MLASAAAVIALLGSVAAPDHPQAGPERARSAAPREGKRPLIRQIDRAHVVGAPVLDGEARPGVYVWREDGLFRFAVVGPASATTEFQVRASQGVEVVERDGIVWQRRAPRHLLARGRSGRGALRSRGHIKIGLARRGKRRVRIFVGPLAARAASTVEIGAFGALRVRSRR